jgi:hypothetical protein
MAAGKVCALLDGLTKFPASLLQMWSILHDNRIMQAKAPVPVLYRSTGCFLSYVDFPHAEYPLCRPE